MAALWSVGDPWAGPYAPAGGAGTGRRPRRPVAAKPALAQVRPPEREGTTEVVPRRAAGSSRAARRAGRVVGRALLALPVAATLAVLLALSLPVPFGCRSLVVMSGSMEPAISTGSVVLVKHIPGAAIAVGDVISFRHPEDPGRMLTHRVQSVHLEEGRVAVETRGDANTGTESWAIDSDGAVGRVIFRVPWLGYALAPLQGMLPRLLMVVAPAVLLAALLLVDIWREPSPGRRCRPGRAPRPARSRA